jgi:hypothetical protein
MVAVRVEKDGEARGRREIGGRAVVAGGADEFERGADDAVEALCRLLQELDPVAADDALVEQAEQPDEAEQRVAGVVGEPRRQRAERSVAGQWDERALELGPLLPLGERLYC